MKIRNVGTAATVICTGVLIVQVAIMAILRVSIMELSIIAISIVVCCYFFSKYIIKKFVIYRIKPIYQIVSSKDFNTRDLEQELAHKQNMISSVEGELTNWAERNRKEIHRLKENENEK